MRCSPLIRALSGKAAKKHYNYLELTDRAADVHSLNERRVDTKMELTDDERAFMLEEDVRRSLDSSERLCVTCG